MIVVNTDSSLEMIDKNRMDDSMLLENEQIGKRIV